MKKAGILIYYMCPGCQTDPLPIGSYEDLHAMGLAWISFAVCMDCMSKVLFLPHTKYNNKFIKVKSTSTLHMYFDQSVTVENPE